MARPNKGQHKVPRTYLEAFTNKDGKFWVADERMNIRPGKPNNVLIEKDYYTVRFPTGGGTLAVETEFLGGIETAYSNIYRKKIELRIRLTLQEKATMAVFLASMLERGPRRREAMQEFFDKIRKRSGQMNAMIAAMSPEEKKRFIAAQPPTTEESRKNSIPSSELSELGKDIPSLHSSGLPDSVSSVAPVIFEMKWGFMVRPSGSKPFLTSDNPCVLANPYFPPNSFYGPRLAQKGIELTLPLSPYLALLAGWQLETDGEYIPVNEKMVLEINRRLMRYSATLISNSKDLLEEQVTRINKHLKDNPKDVK